MKKYTRTILALILAVVSALALPINAGATTYSGSLGSNAYTCTVSSAPLKIISKISCSSNSDLQVDTSAYVYVNGSFYNTAQMSKTLGNTRSINHTYTYVKMLETHPTFPSNGTFHLCDYYDYINSTTVLNGVTEYS